MVIKLVMRYDQELSKWRSCNFLHSDNPQLIIRVISKRVSPPFPCDSAGRVVVQTILFCCYTTL